MHEKHFPFTLYASPWVLFRLFFVSNFRFFFFSPFWKLFVLPKTVYVRTLSVVRLRYTFTVSRFLYFFFFPLQSCFISVVSFGPENYAASWVNTEKNKMVLLMTSTVDCVCLWRRPFRFSHDQWVLDRTLPLRLLRVLRMRPVLCQAINTQVFCFNGCNYKCGVRLSNLVCTPNNTLIHSQNIQLLLIRRLSTQRLERKIIIISTQT